MLLKSRPFHITPHKSCKFICRHIFKATPRAYDMTRAVHNVTIRCVAQNAKLSIKRKTNDSCMVHLNHCSCTMISYEATSA